MNKLKQIWWWLTGPRKLWVRHFTCEDWAFNIRPLQDFLFRLHPKYPWMMCHILNSKRVVLLNKSFWYITLGYRQLTANERKLDNQIRRLTGGGVYRTGPAEPPAEWSLLS